MKIGLGQKLGMTRIFDADGKMIAVTKVALFASQITQVKSVDTDGYKSVQIAAIKKGAHKDKTIRKTEFRLDEIDGYKQGDELKNEFATGDVVEITGTSKGKGFAGTIKRYNFKRGPEGHGGNNVREPGSIGAQQPQRVVLGRHMAGHMGMTTVCVKNLRVIDIENDTLLISGAIPGPNKGILRIVSK